MSEPNHMKLRTTVMVVSMIAMPLAAVIGFRWPKFSATEKSTAAAPARPAEKVKGEGGSAPAPTWNTPAEMAATTSTSAAIAQAGGINTADIPGYQVAQAGNNDVHSATDSGGSSASAVVPTANFEEVRPLPPVTNESGDSNDPFHEIQNRLRALGAIHYSLETWGPQGEAYRFQCRMAAGHNPNYSRHFEATDTEPLRVMQTVLSDVEAWKSGRLP